MQSRMSTTPRGSTLQYKSTVSPIHHYIHQDARFKKDTRIKSKKDQKISSQTSTTRKENTSVLTERKNQNNQKGFDLAFCHKKEGLNLRKKNQQLQAKIDKQKNEIESLKDAIQGIKNVKIKTEIKQTEELSKINRALQQRSKEQNKELTFLKQTLASIKETSEQKSDPNQASRRKEIMQYYEQIKTDVPKQGNTKLYCQGCIDRRQMESKYQNQLKSLQVEVKTLKENELLLSVLQQQISNKNTCIDYLRNQLEELERNSCGLLDIIKTLEIRIEAMEAKKDTKAMGLSRPFSSFNTYRDSNIY